MYDKIKFGNSSFNLVRQDYLDNGTMMDLYVSPVNGTSSISLIKGIVEAAEGKFDHLDVNGKVVASYQGYTILIGVSEAKGVFEESKVFLISLAQPAVRKEIAHNTANIEYIAAMSDIELED